MAQSGELSEDPIIEIGIPLSKLKAMDEALQRKPLLESLVESQQKTIDKLESSLADEKKTNDLNQREIYLLNKQHELDQREIAIVNRANERLLEINDRAIKLAEVSKPPVLGNFQLLGIVGGAAALVGYILGSK